MTDDPAPHPRALLLLFGLVASCGRAEDAFDTSLLRDVTAEVGLPVADGSWPAGTLHVPEAMQGGVGLLDFDGDGRLDVLHARVPPPGTRPEAITPRLYRQRNDGRFEDVTASAGLDAPFFGQGLAVGDVDNDGDVDVYFTNFGPDLLYRNDGGVFTDVTSVSGLTGNRWSTAASFLDFDRDGFLDLYVVHYMHYDRTKVCEDPSSRREYCGPRSFPGWADKLYRNRGDGTFADVTEEAGIVLPNGGARAHGLGILCTDFTGDGRLDVFVANDAQSNQLWVGREDGTFGEEGILRGVATSGIGRPEASMGVTAGDVDGDGTVDLFMTHLWKENNRLYVRPGPGAVLFQDASTSARLSGVDLGRTGFGCGLFDLDHDGDLDLAVANGAIRRREALPGAPEGWWSEYAENNQLFRNLGDGRFEELDREGGAFTGLVEVSRGLAFGDLDGDGDLDLVQSNVDNSLRVFRNEAPAPGTHWLLVRALEHRRDALGAQVVVSAAGRRTTGLVVAASSYLSSNDPRAHFGLGRADVVDGIEVLWPDGTRESFDCAGVDREVVLRKGEGDAR